jgi:hypothetical protein
MILAFSRADGRTPRMYEDSDSNSANRLALGVSGSRAQLSRSARGAILRLLKADNYARDTGRDSWEFAVTIAELRRDGVSENDLRWLVCRGYIEHAAEATTTARGDRVFDHQVTLRFCNRTAFVITKAGIAFCNELRNRLAHGADDTVKSAAAPGAATLPERSHAVEDARQNSNGHMRPKWDRDRRELRVGGQLVKVFKLPSPMQETILMAFEEENWPPRIDDPLPVHPDLLPKRRLHDTIKSLNRNQKNWLIRFMGDGTGEGIRWELISFKDEVAHAEPALPNAHHC